MGAVSDDHGFGTAGDVPDVSVILAVYNTMPYLTRCLDSLIGQSIGPGRLEIVAVDDGSTDGGGDVLDAFARRHPDTVTLVRQPNSGGPAAPSNRGLELATGRYVFFIGADDYLGREALERMVTVADEYGADVVAGRMVGENGRQVPLGIFAQTDYDVDLFTSALPFAVSNTKLFRRELVERHGLRYREDLQFGSDQPFTVAACVHAKRIAVLADYDYYYAVRRRNQGNITYRSTEELRLRCTGEIMAETAALLAPGTERDAIMRRSFTAELSKLTRAGFLKLDRATQESVAAGIGRLADLYLTDDIRDGLDASRRVRLSLAQRGMVDDLVAVVAQNEGPDYPRLVPVDGRLHLAYRCFRDSRMLPDEWFLVTGDPAESAARQLDVRSAAWQTRPSGRQTLVVTMVSPTGRDLVNAATTRIGVGRTAGQLSFEDDGPDGTLVRARFPLRQLMAECPPLGGVRELAVSVTLAGATAETPLRLLRRMGRPSRLGRLGRRVYVARPEPKSDRELAVVFVPVTVRAVARRLWGRLAAKTRRA